MIIFFSRIVDENVKRQYPSNIPLGGADDNFNRRIIEGLEQNGENPVLINYMPYHSFPSGKFLVYKREETFVGSRRTINVGYINVPGIKTRSLKRNIVKAVKDLLKDVDVSERNFIIIYDLYDAFLLAALELKRWNNNIKTILITPSIPTIDVPRDGIKAKLYIMFAERAVKMATKMDAFVFLTKYMNEVFNKGNAKPYVVIEGVAPDMNGEKVGELPDELIGEKYVLYSGRLDKIYGIDKLVECFRDNNFGNLKLALCGIGDCESIIKEAVKETNSIIYLGFLNRPELNAAQRSAYFLINTRTADGEYTKYSFPSKTMEYLVSGRPTIMFKLPGIPNEYDQYLDYINENSILGIAKSIECLCNGIENGISQRKADEGFKFAIEKKSSQRQSKKIIDLINEMWE